MDRSGDFVVRRERTGLDEHDLASRVDENGHRQANRGDRVGHHARLVIHAGKSDTAIDRVARRGVRGVFGRDPDRPAVCRPLSRAPAATPASRRGTARTNWPRYSPASGYPACRPDSPATSRASTATTGPGVACPSELRYQVRRGPGSRSRGTSRSAARSLHSPRMAMALARSRCTRSLPRGPRWPASRRACGI